MNANYSNENTGKTNFFQMPLRDISQFKTIEMPFVKECLILIKSKELTPFVDLLHLATRE